MHRLQFAPPGECRWTEALEALLRAELPAEDTVEGADEQRYSKSARWALLERWRASPALTLTLTLALALILNPDPNPNQGVPAQL